MSNPESEEVIAVLAQFGIDYNDALRRMAGNAELYKKLTKHYAADENYIGFVEAMAQNDLDAAYAHVHTLKGVAGNLSFNTLYDLASQACVALRSDAPEEARALIDALGEADKNARAGLEYWESISL